jgi:hypothetical protein
MHDSTSYDVPRRVGFILSTVWGLQLTVVTFGSCEHVQLKRGGGLDMF